MAGMGHSAATAALDQVPPGDRTEPVDVQNRRKLQKQRHERCICMHMALRASTSESPAPGHARLQCRGLSCSFSLRRSSRCHLPTTPFSSACSLPSRGRLISHLSRSLGLRRCVCLFDRTRARAPPESRTNRTHGRRLIMHPRCALIRPFARAAAQLPAPLKSPETGTPGENFLRFHKIHRAAIRAARDLRYLRSRHFAVWDPPPDSHDGGARSRFDTRVFVRLRERRKRCIWQDGICGNETRWERRRAQSTTR
ncbi:hypothetical protein PYCCODRAFT_250594 [Trametes coccinea BRFM310]|uniref:Uncharacterized protein n=1 Tax=Trametes coccinea (strain BRFM310) TaxID=1353009 RepID=A0A1Y2IQ02_TRAC3|nr:hypothetical protein PYCCODRAFT_250594 [Trametes coccinea BRFM310]